MDRYPKEEKANHEDNCRKGIPGAQKSEWLLCVGGGDEASVGQVVRKGLALEDATGEAAGGRSLRASGPSRDSGLCPGGEEKPLPSAE